MDRGFAVEHADGSSTVPPPVWTDHAVRLNEGGGVWVALNHGGVVHRNTAGMPGREFAS